AVFLHGAAWHIGFNLLALQQIGPEIEELFGRRVMLLLFMVTGVVANLGSEAFGLDLPAVGASGAIMGLIGVAPGWGPRDGTSIGRRVRGMMLRWAGYTMVFGLFIHADNAAHGVGFVSGAVLGFAIPPGWARRALAGGAGLVMGAAGGVAAAATFALC